MDDNSLGIEPDTIIEFRVRCTACMSPSYEQIATRKLDEGWSLREFQCLDCGHRFRSKKEPKVLPTEAEKKIWREVANVWQVRKNPI